MIYSVLVVDSKDYYRKATIQKLLTGFHNISIVGEACDGDEALLKAEALHPNIVILDCSLERIDSFSCLQQIRAKRIQTHFILTSEFDNFSFIQRAIRLGVHDYLLKPLNNAELHTAVENVCKCIEKERTNSGISQSGMSLFVHRCNAWSNAAISEMTNDRLCRAMANNFSVPFPGAFFSFAAIRLMNNAPSTSLHYAVCSMASDILNSCGSIQCFYSTSSPADIFIIINHIRENDQLRSRLEFVSQCIQSTFQISCTLALTSPVRHFSSLKEKCNDLTSLLNQSLCLSKNKIIQLQDVQSLVSTPIAMSHTQIDDILRLMQSSEDLASSTVISDYLHFLVNSHLTQEAVIQSCVMSLKNIQHTMQKICRHTDISDGRTEYLKEVVNCSQLHQLQALFLNCIVELSQKYSFSHQTAGKKVVSSIIARLETEYSKNIRLSSYASAYYINQSYLSELFLQETGINFSQYLQNLRMNKAKELLSQTTYPTGKIAELVGYNDRNYFASVFSRLFGVTPMQYRNMQKASCS